MTFTDSRPSDTDAYSTIYVGGDDSRFTAYGSYFGLAEQIDYGNRDSRDEAFVFSDQIAATITHGDATAFTAALGEIIGHEAGHLLGGKHSDGCDSALAAVASITPPANIRWDASPNYGNRPAGQIIDTIVIHTTEGPAGSAINTFKNAANQVSAHYVISPTGGITQMVALDKRAWHATYYNNRSIGIEMDGYAARTDTWNSQNLAALTDLVAWLVTEYQIQPAHPEGDARQELDKRYHGIGLVGHSQIQPGGIPAGPDTGNVVPKTKTDPGQHFLWPTFISGVKSKLDSLSPTVASAGVSPTSVAAGNQLAISFNSRDNTGGTGIDHVSLLLYPATGNTPINTRDLYGVGGVLHNVPDGRLTPESFDITTAGTDSFNWRVFNALQAGNYRIKVVAWDRAGNPSAPYYVPFTVTAANSPLPKLRISDISISESHTGTTAIFDVTLTSTSSQPVAIQYRTVNGTATANSDYQAIANGSLTIPAGSTSRQISVTIIGDRVVETDEYFDVELVSATNAVRDDSFGRATIHNDDQNRLGASLNSVSVTEGNSGSMAATLRITLTAPAPQAFSLGWNTVADTAAAGPDFVAVSNGSVNFATGDTFKDITVSVIGDAVIESAERFFVFLKSAPSFLNIDNVSGAVTINDNDRPTISVATPTNVTEGNSGTRNVDFVVRLSAASTQTVTVDYATVNGTAQSGSDYTTRTGTVTFNPGITQQTVSVPVLGDMILEPNETFSLVLSNPSNTGLLDPSAKSAMATILNDDQAPLPYLSIIGKVDEEGDVGTRTTTVTIHLSAPSSQPVTFRFRTEDGSALSTSDYVAQDRSITFVPNQTSQLVGVEIRNDLVPEGEEFFRVRLYNASGATITGETAQVTVRDNDVPTIIVSDKTVTEGTGGTTTATFTVNLSIASSQTVQVAYRTATDGSATSGVDYQATNGTLTFTSGQTSKTFNVTVISDAQDEPNELYDVVFS